MSPISSITIFKQCPKVPRRAIHVWARLANGESFESIIFTVYSDLAIVDREVRHFANRVNNGLETNPVVETAFEFYPQELL